MPETKENTIEYIDRLIKDGMEDEQLIAGYTVQNAVGKFAKIFQPMFEESSGAFGWVAIQGNLNHDKKYEF